MWLWWPLASWHVVGHHSHLKVIQLLSWQSDVRAGFRHHQFFILGNAAWVWRSTITAEIARWVRLGLWHYEFLTWICAVVRQCHIRTVSHLIFASHFLGFCYIFLADNTGVLLLNRMPLVAVFWLAFVSLVCLWPSVLWRCWLGSRKGIRPVKNWVVRCWRGYLSGARCRLAYGPADATATHCLLLQ